MSYGLKEFKELIEKAFRDYSDPLSAPFGMDPYGKEAIQYRHNKREAFLYVLEMMPEFESQDDVEMKLLKEHDLTVDFCLQYVEDDYGYKKHWGNNDCVEPHENFSEALKVMVAQVEARNAEVR